MRNIVRACIAATVFVFASSAYAVDTVKVGLLKYGTVNWEIKAMLEAGIDADNGIAVEIVPYASGDATKIALQGGEVDVIVSDWLWVSRLRSSGENLTFVPYSSSVGAIMVPGDSDMQSLADLKGRKIGVAGGPLDKSWLLLQGMARQEFDLDLADANEIVFGAPPLLAEKTRDGELDAMLNYWHYCARLEPLGFKRLVSAEDAASALGATGPISAIGYVFSDEWAAEHREAALGFVNASRATKVLLRDSDEAWQQLSDSGAIKDKPEALAALRTRFREGIPVRPLAEEIADASKLYGILADLGGKKLVGDSPNMAVGTYWLGQNN